MEFGRVATAELDKMDCSLPAEPAANSQVLSGITNNHPGIYIGAPRLGAKPWLGKIFPSHTKEKDYLSQYVQQFNSIEFNATHYKIFSPQQVAKWTVAAHGKSFRFCPKLLQEISHTGRLTQHGALLDVFLSGITAFQPYLGPVFIQLSDGFTPNRQAELCSFLADLPTDISFFLELRHTDWFTATTTSNSLFAFLREHGIGLVITDTPGRRDVAHMQLTVPKAFVRFVGHDGHATDYSRLDAWVERLHHWINNGIEEVYFFLHMIDDATTPEMANYFVQQLNTRCNLGLQPPNFIPQAPVQTALF